MTSISPDRIRQIEALARQARQDTLVYRRHTFTEKLTWTFGALPSAASILLDRTSSRTTLYRNGTANWRDDNEAVKALWELQVALTFEPLQTLVALAPALHPTLALADLTRPGRT